MSDIHSYRRHQVIVASLLHDIGKFWQRGDEFLRKSNHINEPKDSWGWLVPTNPKTKNPAYQHAIWTYQFLEDREGAFSKLGIWKFENKLSELSAKHHQPETPLQALIQLADWWSSGIDRNAVKSDEDKDNIHEIDWGALAFRKTPMYSIFDRLRVNKSKGKNLHAYSLQPLNIEQENAMFPYALEGEKLEQLKSGNLQKGYRELWESFTLEFEQLPLGNFEAFSTSLFYLLKKFTWCIPSSTVDVPDVSLFEHLKTTAAIAGCLYDFQQEQPEAFTFENRRLKLKGDVDPLLLCCLDLSGIQNFIYDVASSKAYKSMKGRSFYLQLMLDQILTFLLTNLNQGLENIVYSSGGKAYFLLPNAKWVVSQLEPLLSEIETFLWNEHKGKIFAAFGKVSFRYEFIPGEKEGKIGSNERDSYGVKIVDLGHLWKEVSDTAAKQKNRRFGNILLSSYDDLFLENGKEAIAGQRKEICAVTGQPIIGRSANIGRNEIEIEVLPSVKKQTDLGTALKECDLLITYGGEARESLNLKRYNNNNDGIFFSSLKRHAYLLPDMDELDQEISFNKIQSRSGTAFFSINKTRFLETKRPVSLQSGYGFLFYGGNKQPEIEDRNENFRSRTLEELCWIDPKDESKGYSKLGILRMDVDNLGQLFIHGLPNQEKSFAAYGTLSFQLDLFFSGYLNTIRNQVTYKDHVTILYSGGDDVFAVGRWDKVLNFALEVRSLFQEYVGRPDISISAGLAIVDRKYPIYKAAEIAGNAEKSAKDFKGAGKKNAINFFGETVSWNREFLEAKALKTKMVELCIIHNMSRSLLHQLQRYKSLRDDSEQRELEKGEPLDFSYKWHSAYYLKRFADRYEKKQDILKWIDGIQSRILHDNEFGSDRFLSLLALGARWAEYELKLKN